MSVAFIPVEDWANQTQDLIGFNELVLAYSERRQTLGQSAVDPLTAGVSGFDKTLCLAMQEWCEANCTSFLDYRVDPPLNVGGTDFLYFTLATWRAAAGLNASGFRRRVEPDDADSYGTIEVGDTRGDWCFEDLQKAFSALRWPSNKSPVWNPDFSSASYWCHVNIQHDRYGVITYDEMGPEWDVTPMQYAGVNGYYRFLYGKDTYFYDGGSHYPGHFFAGVWHSGAGSVPYDYITSRKRVDITFQKIAGLDGTADIYFRGKNYPDWYAGSPPFVDLDSLGITNGNMLYYTTLASMDNTSTGLIGGTGIWYTGVIRGYSCDILVNRKWNFTNQG